MGAAESLALTSPPQQQHPWRTVWNTFLTSSFMCFPCLISLLKLKGQTYPIRPTRQAWALQVAQVVCRIRCKLKPTKWELRVVKSASFTAAFCSASPTQQYLLHRNYYSREVSLSPSTLVQLSYMLCKPFKTYLIKVKFTH